VCQIARKGSHRTTAFHGNWANPGGYCERASNPGSVITKKFTFVVALAVAMFGCTVVASAIETTHIARPHTGVRARPLRRYSPRAQELSERPSTFTDFREDPIILTDFGVKA